MRKVILFYSIMLVSLQLAAQPLAPKDFTVSGKVKNGVRGEKVILSRSTATGSLLKLDSTQIAADKSFSFNAKENDRGTFFVMDIANRQKVVLLVEGGEKFTVLADGTGRDEKGNGGKVEVKGSANMEYYSQVDQIMSEFAAKKVTWGEEFQKAEEKQDVKKMEEIKVAFAKADQERTGAIKALLPQMGTSLVALWTVNNFLNPEEELELYKKLADDYQKVEQTPTLAKGFIGTVKRMAGISVGQEAPDFTLNSPEGTPIQLSSLRGKYVLIDFWASWCGPCRMENPNVVRMYDKFKDKGFDIYGVSLDDNEKAWKAAIAKDNLTWRHGSELKKWRSGVAQSYGVNAIPATFLLDKEGKIIAKNLRGKALEDKLAELLGAQ